MRKMQLYKTSQSCLYRVSTKNIKIKKRNIILPGTSAHRIKWGQKQVLKIKNSSIAKSK